MKRDGTKYVYERAIICWKSSNKSDFQVVIVIFSPISGLAGGLNTMLPFILQNLLVS